MPKQDTSQDRNFDDLAKRFARKIYGSLKGAARLAVLERDLAEHTDYLSQAPQKTLRILDAGGGQAQFSLALAALGHEVVVCDISQEMLALAHEQVRARGLENNVQLLHCSLQEVGAQLRERGEPGGDFDLVICHAVMEWMSEPQTLLPNLLKYAKPAGHISLIFYNVHSLVFKNLLRGNYKKIASGDIAGWRGSLTPINPLEPDEVMDWVAELPLKMLAHSGIRVFHDYILDPATAALTQDEALEAELYFSQLEPYRSLGRYQHLLMQVKAGSSTQ